MKKVFKDILTGKDNETFELGRLLWAIGVMVFLALTIVSYITQTPFDYTSWGVGFGAVLAAGGLGIKVKESSEPDVKPTEEDLRAREIARRLARRKAKLEENGEI